MELSRKGDNRSHPVYEDRQAQGALADQALARAAHTETLGAFQSCDWVDTGLLILRKMKAGLWLSPAVRLTSLASYLGLQR